MTNINDKRFKAIFAKSSEDIELTEITLDDLTSEGDVIVEIESSSLNYKDALALCGNQGNILKTFPMVPGIDLAGKVLASESDKFKEGDNVLATGMGLGETICGGMSKLTRIQSDILIKRPSNISSQVAMGFGTAGFTAQLCVMALQKNDITPDKGPIAVTGATGGVGSIAISLLSKLGYKVTAISSRKDLFEKWLTDLGASQIIKPSDITEGKERPLDKTRWAGVVDNLGGTLLSRLLAQVQPQGVVTAVGLASSHVLNTTVMPFILRGVSLIGINSVDCPYEKRQKVWQELFASNVEPEVSTIQLEEAIETAKKLLDHRLYGRKIINL